MFPAKLTAPGLSRRLIFKDFFRTIFKLWASFSTKIQIQTGQAHASLAIVTFYTMPFDENRENRITNARVT